MVAEQARTEADAFRALGEADLTALRDLLDKALTACQATLPAPPRRVALAKE
ncbi:hypothetical protein ACFQV2_07560 [Actinokineospora soli]|uniref:MarR family transcriptional regulator n=1 Tax=Actinokineospora soli TaxID=1048753 RepID=A0ABW2TIA7_9PSEU